jgi:hypothetical protein
MRTIAIAISILILIPIPILVAIAIAFWILMRTRHHSFAGDGGETGWDNNYLIKVLCS